MNRKMIVLAVLVALTSWPALAVLAQNGGGYDLTWSTIDGGGGVSTGSGYTLSGTAGQPDAGLLAGGNYTLAGGFWGGGVLLPGPEHTIYLPLVVRSQ
jgi:hypothetical protein